MKKSVAALVLLLCLAAAFLTADSCAIGVVGGFTQKGSIKKG